MRKARPALSGLRSAGGYPHHPSLDPNIRRRARDCVAWRGFVAWRWYQFMRCSESALLALVAMSCTVAPALAQPSQARSTRSRRTAGPTTWRIARASPRAARKRSNACSTIRPARQAPAEARSHAAQAGCRRPARSRAAPPPPRPRPHRQPAAGSRRRAPRQPATHRNRRSNSLPHAPKTAASKRRRQRTAAAPAAEPRPRRLNPHRRRRCRCRRSSRRVANSRSCGAATRPAGALRMVPLGGGRI